MDSKLLRACGAAELMMPASAGLSPTTSRRRPGNTWAEEAFFPRRERPLRSNRSRPERTGSTTPEPGSGPSSESQPDVGEAKANWTGRMTERATHRRGPAPFTAPASPFDGIGTLTPPGRWDGPQCTDRKERGTRLPIEGNRSSRVGVTARGDERASPIRASATHRYRGTIIGRMNRQLLSYLSTK